MQPPYSQQPLINKYLHQLVQFHQSPRMKYWYHCVCAEAETMNDARRKRKIMFCLLQLFYCFFLLLFSYVLLFRFRIPRSEAPSIDWTEILLIILVSFMLIEEIHHVRHDGYDLLRLSLLIIFVVLVCQSRKCHISRSMLRLRLKSIQNDESHWFHSVLRWSHLALSKCRK